MKLAEGVIGWVALGVAGPSDFVVRMTPLWVELTGGGWVEQVLPTSSSG